MCCARRAPALRGAAIDVYGNALASTQTTGGHWDAHHDNAARFLVVAQSRENGLDAAYELADAYTDTLPRGSRGVLINSLAEGRTETPQTRKMLAPHRAGRRSHRNEKRLPSTFYKAQTPDDTELCR